MGRSHQRFLAIMNSQSSFIMENLEKKSKSGIESVEKTIDSIYAISDNIRNIGGSFKENRETINDVSESLSSIVAQSQELSAASHEASSTLAKMRWQDLQIKTVKNLCSRVKR